MKKTIKKKNPYVEINPELDTKNECVVYFGIMSPPTKIQEELFEELSKKNCSTKIYKSKKRRMNEEDCDFLTNRAFGNVRIIDSLDEVKDELSEYKNITYYIDEELYNSDALLENVLIGESGLTFEDYFNLKENVHSSLVNETRFIMDLIELEEGLSPATRMRKANSMKAHKRKLENARKRALERRSAQQVASKRAKNMAIRTLKTRLASGRKTSDLSPSEKSRIEDIIKRRSKFITQTARKYIKKVRDLENVRLSTNEAFEVISEMYDGLNKE